jgi:hypothetical protein
MSVVPTVVKAVPKVVFIPFEWDRFHRRLVRCINLPRFTDIAEVRGFMLENPKRLERRMVQWIEHDEPWAILEYVKDVGRNV